MTTLAFKAPRSFELPGGTGRKGDGHDRTPVQVPRAVRVPGALWRPRRWLLALPAIVDERDLDGWLAWASAGMRCAYHVGELARDRHEDAELDLLARALIFRSSATVIASSTCGHARGIWRGSRDVTLLQLRVAPARWLYTAVRLG